MIKSRVEIKHFSIVGLMSPGWVRTQVRTHSDFCWTRGLGLGLWPTGLGLGLGLWFNGLGLGLGLWSNGLGLTPDGLGLWSNGLGLGLGLWPCGLGLIAGLTSPDSLQHWSKPPGVSNDPVFEFILLIVIHFYNTGALSFTVNCYELHSTDDDLTDGYYEIDADRGGPLPPFMVWCDMANGGIVYFIGFRKQSFLNNIVWILKN